MDLVLQGRSIAKSARLCDAHTPQSKKARHTMAAHQITTCEQLAGITDEEMATWFVYGRHLAQGDFVPFLPFIPAETPAHTTAKMANRVKPTLNTADGENVWMNIEASISVDTAPIRPQTLAKDVTALMRSSDEDFRIPYVE